MRLPSTAARAAVPALGAAMALATATVVLLPSPGWACSCPRSSAAERFEAATAAFTGVVVATTNEVAELDVHAVYKGDVPRRVSVGGRGDCAPPFVPGERYAVYARAARDGLLTDVCWGTTQDVASFDRAHRLPLLTYTSPTVPAPASRAGPVVAAALLAAAAAIAVADALRRRLERRRISGV